MSFRMTRSGINLQNLLLSYRGSERQPPSIITLSLRLADNVAEGVFPRDYDANQKLASVIEYFHACPGMLSKWNLDDTKRKAVMNFIQGTSPGSREVIAKHLHAVPRFNLSTGHHVILTCFSETRQHGVANA